MLDLQINILYTSTTIQSYLTPPPLLNINRNNDYNSLRLHSTEHQVKNYVFKVFTISITIIPISILYQLHVRRPIYEAPN